MELQDLVGRHILSGVDKVTVPSTYDQEDSREIISFVLDGKTYTAVEDPEDGYRSSMKELLVSNEPTVNNFPGQVVLASMRGIMGLYTEDSILDLHDAQTNKVVLSVGTHNYEDYYPVWVAEFHPENMAINNSNA